MAFKEQKFGNGTIRRNYQKSKGDLQIFDLLQVQKESFQKFIDEGIKEVFEEIYPVVSTNGKLRVEYISHRLEFPSNYETAIKEAKAKGSNFFAPLKATFKLIDNIEGTTISKDEAFIVNLPLMTNGASFIINGSERVIISQIVRSPGAYFENLKTARAQSASYSSVFKLSTLIPNRGAWIEFDYKDYKFLGIDASDLGDFK